MLAFLLAAAIVAHVSAVPLHTVTLRDRMFRLAPRNGSGVKSR